MEEKLLVLGILKNLVQYLSNMYSSWIIGKLDNILLSHILPFSHCKIFEDKDCFLFCEHS